MCMPICMSVLQIVMPFMLVDMSVMMPVACFAFWSFPNMPVMIPLVMLVVMPIMILSMPVVMLVGMPVAPVVFLFILTVTTGIGLEG